MARTTFQCRCGERIPMTVNVGKAEPDGDRFVVPISFSTVQFYQDYATHVLADPERPEHSAYVIRKETP